MLGSHGIEAVIAQQVRGHHGRALGDHVPGQRGGAHGQVDARHPAPADDLALVHPGPAPHPLPVGLHLEEPQVGGVERLRCRDHRLAQHLVEVARAQSELADPSHGSLLADGQVPFAGAAVRGHLAQRLPTDRSGICGSSPLPTGWGRGGVLPDCPGDDLRP